MSIMLTKNCLSINLEDAFKIWLDIIENRISFDTLIKIGRVVFYKKINKCL